MIEPRLTSYSGHLYNYASSLKKEVENSGGQFKILVSKDCDLNILRELNGVQVFDTNPPDKYFHNIFSKFFVATFVCNLHLFRGLKRSKQILGGDWTYFMGTAQYIDFFAIFLFNFFIKKSNKFILTLRLSIFRYDLQRWSINVFWYWLGINFLFLQNYFKKNIRLITDSETLKQEFERITCFNIHVLPIPHTNIFSDKIFSSKNNSEIIVISLGPARLQKGFNNITELINSYLINKNDFKHNVVFKLHCVNSNNDNSISESINYLKSLNSKNVELIDCSLTELEYFQILNNSDIILLPYNSLSYYAQTSGIFTEALSMGKPVIVTKNTWMSIQLEKFASGLSIKENDNVDFYENFKIMVNNFDEFSQSSITSMRLWNSFHNSTNFLHQLDNL
jgi:glycosyltransferase involved in cell wall biosynthesis